MAVHEHCSHEKAAHSHDLDAKIKKRLLVSISLTGVIFLAELIGGFYTNSLALMSDAAHVFMDVAMEEVMKPVPDSEVRAGAGSKVVITIGPSVNWRPLRSTPVACSSGLECHPT